jgi:hypothetical protein
MRSLLAAAVLGFAPLTAHATAPVTVTQSYIELDPVRLGDTTEWTVFYVKNNTAQTLSMTPQTVWGMFDTDWYCGPTGRLEPYGQCEYRVRVDTEQYPKPGYHTGLIELELATGTVQIELAGFFYSSMPKTGIKNVVNSLTTLGLPAAALERLRPPAVTAKNILVDAYTSNDGKACAYLRSFIYRAEQEAAANRITDWEALVLITQTEAVLARVKCCNR